MSDRHNRFTELSAPETELDRSVIQRLQEDRLVIHFSNETPLGDAYVNGPATTESVVHAFPMLTLDGDTWERTTIDVLALAHALQQWPFSVDNESQSPFANNDD